MVESLSIAQCKVVQHLSQQKELKKIMRKTFTKIKNNICVNMDVERPLHRKDTEETTTKGVKRMMTKHHINARYVGRPNGTSQVTGTGI